MGETLRLTIDLPGFYVVDARKGAAAAGAAIEEYLEDVMGCDDEVVVVFHRYDEVDGHVLEHLAGRIVGRDVAVDGQVAQPISSRYPAPPGHDTESPTARGGDASA